MISAVPEAYTETMHGYVKILADEVGRDQSASRESYDIVRSPRIMLDSAE
jgi:hypothetical protein